MRPFCREPRCRFGASKSAGNRGANSSPRQDKGPTGIAGRPFVRSLQGGGRSSLRRCPGRSYWRSLSTSCGIWLACATIAVPACCSTWARDRFAVSAAKSASWIGCARPRRSGRVLHVRTVEVKRFWTAPSEARVESIVASAASIDDSAAFAPATVEMSRRRDRRAGGGDRARVGEAGASAKTTLPVVAARRRVVDVDGRAGRAGRRQAEVGDRRGDRGTDARRPR